MPYVYETGFVGEPRKIEGIFSSESEAKANESEFRKAFPSATSGVYQVSQEDVNNRVYYEGRILGQGGTPDVPRPQQTEPSSTQVVVDTSTGQNVPYEQSSQAQFEKNLELARQQNHISQSSAEQLRQNYYLLPKQGSKATASDIIQQYRAAPQEYQSPENLGYIAGQSSNQQIIESNLQQQSQTYYEKQQQLSTITEQSSTQYQDAIARQYTNLSTTQQQQLNFDVKFQEINKLPLGERELAKGNLFESNPNKNIGNFASSFFLTGIGATAYAVKHPIKSFIVAPIELAEDIGYNLGKKQFPDIAYEYAQHPVTTTASLVVPSFIIGEGLGAKGEYERGQIKNLAKEFNINQDINIFSSASKATAESIPPQKGISKSNIYQYSLKTQEGELPLQNGLIQLPELQKTNLQEENLIVIKPSPESKITGQYYLTDEGGFGRIEKGKYALEQQISPEGIKTQGFKEGKLILESFSKSKDIPEFNLKTRYEQAKTSIPIEEPFPDLSKKAISTTQQGSVTIGQREVSKPFLGLFEKVTPEELILHSESVSNIETTATPKNIEIFKTKTEYPSLKDMPSGYSLSQLSPEFTTKKSQIPPDILTAFIEKGTKEKGFLSSKESRKAQIINIQTISKGTINQGKSFIRLRGQSIPKGTKGAAFLSTGIIDETLISEEIAKTPTKISINAPKSQFDLNLKQFGEFDLSSRIKPRAIPTRITSSRQKDNQKQEQSQNLFRQFIDQSQIGISAIGMRQSNLPYQEIRINQIPTQIPTTGQKQTPIQTPIQEQIPFQTQKPISTFVPPPDIPVFRPSKPPKEPKIDINPPPEIPVFNLKSQQDFFNFGKTPKGRRKAGYTSSLVAEEYGIKTKLPYSKLSKKVYSGLEIRPVLNLFGKKQRKKR